MELTISEQQTSTARSWSLQKVCHLESKLAWYWAIDEGSTGQDGVVTLLIASRLDGGLVSGGKALCATWSDAFDGL